ncbi:unnamed protein product [Darwinula stevensoni]|uniref:Uncharacterized protein n=1 Tax=Darwinula stevensoni TaxID=69355 RepID=A0A7R9AFF2_9CRUS|nr:unnamed protein product [Darwinula stevensoni]CAG0902930.1 unnamed protein product [Darwinula stevensoni]
MEMRESLSKARKKVNEPSSVSRLLSALQHNDANFLPAMKKYHEKYVELKRKLADENPEMKETLRLVPDEFPTQLQEGFVLGGAGGISQPRVLPPPGSTTTQHPQEHIGVRRSKLIERAFAGAVPTRMVAKCLNAEESPTKIAEECDSSTGKGDGNSKTAESPKSRRDILVSCERDSLPSENSDVQDHSDDEEIILPHAPT